MARNKIVIKAERRITKVKYFFKGVKAKRTLEKASKSGVLPVNSLALYRDMARAKMDIKEKENA